MPWALAAEQGLVQLLAVGTKFDGGGHWPAQEIEERRGVVQMHQGAGGLPGYQEQRYAAPIILPCWPRHMGEVGQPSQGLSVLTEALTYGRQNSGTLVGGRAASAQRASCCWRATEQPRGGRLFPPRPHRGPPPAGQILGATGGDESEHGCGSARASVPKPTSCWHRSTAGSPKASTPLTSRRPGRCWEE